MEIAELKHQWKRVCTKHNIRFIPLLRLHDAVYLIALFLFGYSIRLLSSFTIFPPLRRRRRRCPKRLPHCLWQRALLILHPLSSSGDGNSNAAAVPVTRDPTAATLASANTDFDPLFSKHIALPPTTFEADNTPFYLLSLGLCAFFVVVAALAPRVCGGTRIRFSNALTSFSLPSLSNKAHAPPVLSLDLSFLSFLDPAQLNSSQDKTLSEPPARGHGI
ncbi:hypothetical protein MSAN_01634900 [Mycena sanguinolenta]|uniref:Transmembrane protein n=1 Tax=Mycena sanguinolenta TaxID=230812 RepID=A0A8H6XZZ5_9AGAR|nr:hypothetical protein MSAN_01634900 [Mycena sanguinolenta]